MLERINQIFRNLVIQSITPRSIRFYDNSVLTNFSSDHLGCLGRCNVAKGKNGFGYLHILRNHGHEFNRLRPPIDVFEFLVKKLGQGGSFHYQSNKRKGLYLAMLPSGFIFLDYIAQGKDSFFTIVTAYTSTPDGENIGRYISIFQVKP